MVKKSIDPVHGPEHHDLGESSDSVLQEETEKRESKTMCQHVAKSVNLADVKRQLKAGRKIGNCDKKVPTPCSLPTTGNAQEVVRPARVPDGVWLCLQCGHQGCATHAKQHVNVPRSDSHVLAVSVELWNVWCFTCGEPILLKSNKKLHEAVQFVKKRQGTLRPAESPPKDDTPSNKSTHACAAKTKPTTCDKDREVLPKVRGLINLGNTCYLNSVLQCIGQCHYLAHYLDLGSRAGRRVTLRDVDGQSMEIVMPEGGPFTAALCDFLKQMHTVGTSAAISPSAVLSKVSQKAGQFVGYEQQDAHELLRVLIENVRQEDLRRHQKQIMHAINLPTKVDPNKVDEATRARVKALGRQVAHTTVDSIFGGQLISLVVCEACKSRTRRMEPFFDLSLPVAEDKPTRPRKLCASGADDDDPGYVLPPKNRAAAAAGGKSRHALKKERRANRKTTKGSGGPGKADSTAGEAPPSPGSGHEPDQPDASEHGSSDQGPCDADEEDNGDAELVIDSLLSELENPAPAENEDSQSRLTAPPDGETMTSSVASLVAATANELAQLSMTSAGTEVASPVSPETERCLVEDPGVTPSQNGDADDMKSQDDEGTVKVVCHVATDREPVTENGRDEGACNCDVGAMSNDVSVAVDDTVRTDALEVNSRLRCNGQLNGTLEGDHAVSSTEAMAPHAPLTNGLRTDAGPDKLVNGDASLDADVRTVCDGSAVAAAGVSCPAQQAATAAAHSLDDISGTRSFCVSPAMEGEGEGDGDSLSRSEWLSRALTTLTARYQASAGECSVLTCLNQYTAPELLTGNNKFGCEKCTQLRNNAPGHAGDSGPGDGESAAAACDSGSGEGESTAAAGDSGSGEGESTARPRTVYSSASKQILVYSPPAVLTLQLKRFQVCAFSLRKVNRHVQFSPTLDLAPFCSSISQDLPQMRRGQRRVLYSLFGVVEHSGRLNSGHYTAYVRVRRRHQLLTVNPAMLTQYVPDAYQLACQAAADGADPAAKGADPAANGADRDTPAEAESEPEPGRWFHVSDTHVTEVTLEKVLKSQAYLLFYERYV